MLIERNGQAPVVDPAATVAPSATIVGDVRIGAGAYVDHGVIVESSGPTIEISEEAIVFAGAIVRSVGGPHRPPFAAAIGPRTIVSPMCVLTGCRIGRNCYVATAATVLQGATIGDGTRIGVAGIVHAGTQVPARSRIGMRQMAVPTANGFLVTSNVEEARDALAATDFFHAAFAADDVDQVALHDEVASKLLAEVRAWQDRGRASSAQ